MKVRPQDAGKWSFRFGYPSLQKWKLGLLVVKNASWVTFIKIIAQLDRRKILPQFSPKNAENENGQQKNRNKKNMENTCMQIFEHWKKRQQKTISWWEKQKGFATWSFPTTITECPRLATCSAIPVPWGDLIGHREKWGRCGFSSKVGRRFFVVKTNEVWIIIFKTGICFLLKKNNGWYDVQNCWWL